MEKAANINSDIFNDRVSVLCEPAELSMTFADSLLQHIEAATPIADAADLNRVIEDLDSPEQIDPWEVVARLASTSTSIGTLLAGRTAARTWYRLHEHTQAVLDGFESDFTTQFTIPKERKILRTALVMQDIGKSLCIAHCGDRRQQEPYNAAVAQNLLTTIDDDVLAPDQKTLTALLAGSDIFGPVLKGQISLEEAQQHAIELQNQCPTAYRRRLADFLPAVYFPDVTAYTSYRSYRQAETGRIVACRADYVHSLFQQGSDGRLELSDPAHRYAVESVLAVLHEEQ